MHGRIVKPWSAARSARAAVSKGLVAALSEPVRDNDAEQSEVYTFGDCSPDEPPHGSAHQTGILQVIASPTSEKPRGLASVACMTLASSPDVLPDSGCCINRSRNSPCSSPLFVDTVVPAYPDLAGSPPFRTGPQEGTLSISSPPNIKLLRRQQARAAASQKRALAFATHPALLRSARRNLAAAFERVATSKTTKPARFCGAATEEATTPNLAGMKEPRASETRVATATPRELFSASRPDDDSGTPRTSDNPTTCNRSSLGCLSPQRDSSPLRLASSDFYEASTSTSRFDEGLFPTVHTTPSTTSFSETLNCQPNSVSVTATREPALTFPATHVDDSIQISPMRRSLIFRPSSEVATTSADPSSQVLKRRPYQADGRPVSTSTARRLSPFRGRLFSNPAYNPERPGPSPSLRQMR